MASLMAALQAKYDSLDPNGFPGDTRPPRFQDRAPEVSAGTPLYPPYVLFTITPRDDFLTFESDDIEEVRLTVVAFAMSQGDADLTIAGIRFGNDAKANNAGFDNGTLPAFTDGLLLSILAARPPVPKQEGRGKDGALTFKTTMEYDVSVQRT